MTAQALIERPYSCLSDFESFMSACGQCGGLIFGQDINWVGVGFGKDRADWWFNGNFNRSLLCIALYPSFC